MGSTYSLPRAAGPGSYQNVQRLLLVLEPGCKCPHRVQLLEVQQHGLHVCTRDRLRTVSRFSRASKTQLRCSDQSLSAAPADLEGQKEAKELE